MTLFCQVPIDVGVKAQMYKLNRALFLTRAALVAILAESACIAILCLVLVPSFPKLRSEGPEHGIEARHQVRMAFQALLGLFQDLGCFVWRKPFCVDAPKCGIQSVVCLLIELLLSKSISSARRQREVNHSALTLTSKQKSVPGSHHFASSFMSTSGCRCCSS